MASLESRMANPVLTLDGVSFVLPNGRTLFSDLHHHFDARRTGLVGRNGVGKSVLARILAGQLAPSRGRCVRTGRVHALAQQIAPSADATVAGHAGLQGRLDALRRIEAGSSDPADFDAVGDRWDIRQRLRSALDRQGLAHVDIDAPAHTLSGGEAMRVALLGAWLSEADWLILDEPSNHLDRPQRQRLIDQLQDWPHGLLVVSHDRQLLDTMECIVELSSLGLASYGGNYGFYAEAKERERHGALQQLEQRKLERQREVQALREQGERMARWQARGHRSGKDANQARILLGRQKARSEESAGKLHQQRAATQQRLDQQVREAAQQVQHEAPIALHALPVVPASRRRVVLELAQVELPFLTGATRHVHLSLSGQQRVGIVGPNGCGKSTLLKVMAGRLDPVAGVCRRAATSVCLDQRLANLAAAQTVLAQMQAANPTAAEGDLRMRLAQLDLDARKVNVPSGSLSGGERLKAALALVLYADPPAQLLLLDEPGNHLDLPSTQALEAMLRFYQGALVVVSHDDVFLDKLGLTHRLLAEEEGWRLSPW